MRLIRTILLSGVCTAMLCAASCSSTDKGEEAAAAEEMQEAHIAGREAARVFVNTVWKDTIQIQNQLLEARAKKSVYDGHPRVEAAFDSAFISTVKSVRPDVAAVLQRHMDSSK